MMSGAPEPLLTCKCFRANAKAPFPLNRLRPEKEHVGWQTRHRLDLEPFCSPSVGTLVQWTTHTTV